MSTVEWQTKEIDKVLKQHNEKGADGKNHVIRDQVMKVPYTFPVVRFTEVHSVDDLSLAVMEILEAKQPGFLTLRNMIEFLNYGLYNVTRGVVTRGADVRYSAAQRNVIKLFGQMAKDGLLPREQVVEGLLRQGIEDAGNVVDAYMAGSMDGMEPTGS